MTTAPPWFLTHYYHPECEAAINYQISLELYAAHMFETMASYFNSHEVALKQFTQVFLQQSSLEMEHARGLMCLQNQRGGRLRLQDIYSHDPSCWENGLTVMEGAFHLKMHVNESLLDLHQLALDKRDTNLRDFLKTHYLFHQLKFLSDLGEHVTNLRQMGAPEPGLADSLFDKLVLGDSVEKN